MRPGIDLPRALHRFRKTAAGLYVRPRAARMGSSGQSACEPCIYNRSPVMRLERLNIPSKLLYIYIIFRNFYFRFDLCSRSEEIVLRDLQKRKSRVAE
ncbi:hypothetical protein MPLSOD_110144 [Mesorhizobium sp. SOD10]|nr:hypothetical protein MPLSOD_110144 [Mesorhizobium sp. SOD10]